MSRILTVARRELRALFDQPTGYVLLVVFLAVNAFLFFRQAFLQGSATLRPMLDLFPWLMLFFVPAVTMRALAEDTRGGQLEVLLAQPLTNRAPARIGAYSAMRKCAKLWRMGGRGSSLRRDHCGKPSPAMQTRRARSKGASWISAIISN